MYRNISVALLAICVILTISSCSAVANTDSQAASIPAPTPTPELTLEQLLADALNLLDGGKYEEAILAYNHIIEIEPKSFDAQFGLGKAYRGAKQADKAIIALKAAKEIQPENVDATLELGGALLDTGSYVEAETLLLPLAGEAEFNPQAGLLLVVAYVGQGKIEETMQILEREELLQTLLDTYSQFIYFGPRNTYGKPEGKGVGIYGICVYIGDYQNGIKSGHGKWIKNVSVFEGEWSQDLPNGYGEVISKDGAKLTGNFKNGLEEGELKLLCPGGEVFLVYSVNGLRQREKFLGDKNGENPSDWMDVPQIDPNTTCGILPWAKMEY